MTIILAGERVRHRLNFLASSSLIRRLGTGCERIQLRACQPSDTDSFGDTSSTIVRWRSGGVGPGEVQSKMCAGAQAGAPCPTQGPAAWLLLHPANLSDGSPKANDKLPTVGTLSRGDTPQTDKKRLIRPAADWPALKRRRPSITIRAK